MATQEPSKRSAGQVFMERLDQWTQKNVLEPMGAQDQKVEAEIKKAIREKVLQSYRNGQKAGPRPEKKGSK